MRGLLAFAAFFVLVSTAAATEATWPIVATVDYPPASAIGPEGGKASVHISVGDDATAVDVEVYGIDGMRVGTDNLARASVSRLASGAVLAFDVFIHPGPGRSSLVVTARAHFARAGDGSAVHTFPFGDEDAAQQDEHSRCVRQDPDGVWIRDPGCEEAPAAADAVPPAPPAPPPPAPSPVAAALPPVVLSVGELVVSPPIGRIARVVGFVVGSYRCPPCPDGMECKPCATPSAIFVAAAPDHPSVGPGDQPGDAIALATDEPDRFEPGIEYRFEIAVTGRRDDPFDGRLLRSQRPDREPIWTDSP